MVFDPMRYDIKWVSLGEESYPSVCAEALKVMYDISKIEQSHNMPEAGGEKVDINILVDVDYAGNKVTRRSHTGVIIFLNIIPINWYSKKQTTIENLTYDLNV